MTEPDATRDIGPFVDSVDHIRCPSCHHPHSFSDLNTEGGTQCNGCGRRLQLVVESYAQYFGWRNVPEGSKEQYR